jgi:hypothetical protein
MRSRAGSLRCKDSPRPSPPPEKREHYCTKERESGKTLSSTSRGTKATTILRSGSKSLVAQVCRLRATLPREASRRVREARTMRTSIKVAPGPNRATIGLVTLPPRLRSRHASPHRVPRPGPGGDHGEPDYGSKNLWLESKPRDVRPWRGLSGSGSVHDELCGGYYSSAGSAKLCRCRAHQ